MEDDRRSTALGDAQGGHSPALAVEPVDLRRGGAGGEAPAAEKPLGQLLGDFAQEISQLVHDEVRLAKAELAGKASTFGQGAAMLAMAAGAGLLAAGALVACAIAALALVVPLWLAALIIGAALMAVAAVTGGVGVARIRRGGPPLPTEAMESAKEDVAWLQSQLKSTRK